MAQITQPSGVPSQTIAGRTITDLSSNLIILYGRSTAANGYSGLMKSDGTNYTPSGTKQFVAVFAVGCFQDSMTTTPPGVGSCNNALPLNTATAPTSPVYFGGSASGTLAGNFTAGRQELNCNLTIPNGKYGFFTVGSGATNFENILVYGYEV